jgi:hypothetical protein
MVKIQSRVCALRLRPCWLQVCVLLLLVGGGLL